MTTRYVVKTGPGISGPLAQVIDTRDNEAISTYSKRAYGRDFKLRAQDDADSLNDSDARVAWNAAHENLLPYVESRDFQRDLED